MTRPPMKLALGPHQYYWPRQAMLDFYADIAEAPVDSVYLGESVCARRHELRLEDWLDVAQVLADAGKEVILSSLVLIESESDLKTLRKIARQRDFRVEANDMAAVNVLAAEGRRDWIAGPTLNVFNPATLATLSELGATRWVVPPELPRAPMAALLAAADPRPEVELTAYGRLPLAYSARCFTARHFNLQKDNCEFRCLQFAEGIPLKTREGQPFLNLNGVQTQSARIYNLLADLPALRAEGVDVLRLLPQSEHMGEIIDTFRRAVDGALPPADAFAATRAWMPEAACNGFWHGQPGVEHYIAA